MGVQSLGKGWGGGAGRGPGGSVKALRRWWDVSSGVWCWAPSFSLLSAESETGNEMRLAYLEYQE